MQQVVESDPQSIEVISVLDCRCLLKVMTRAFNVATSSVLTATSIRCLLVVAVRQPKKYGHQSTDILSVMLGLLLNQGAGCVEILVCFLCLACFAELPESGTYIDYGSISTSATRYTVAHNSHIPSISALGSLGV